jgi:hypothetical protein
MMSWDRHQVTTFLTVVIVGLWIITFIVRIWVPLEQASILDSAMPLVIGYWFVANALKNGKNGAKAHDPATA